MRKTGVFLILAFMALCYTQVSASSSISSLDTKLEVTYEDILKKDSLNTSNGNVAQASRGGESAEQKAKREKKERDKQYKVFKGFVEDSLQIIVRDSNLYKTRDEELQAELDSMQLDQKSLDSRLTAIKVFKEDVEKGMHGNTLSWVRISLLVLLFALVVIVLLLIIIIVIMHNRMIEINERMIKINERIEHRKGEIKKLQEINNDSNSSNHSQVANFLNKKVIELEKKNNELGNKVSLLEDKLKEKKEQSNSEIVLSTNQQSSSKPVVSQKQLYADSIIDGEFSHVWEKENDDTVFVLTQKAENRASININKRAYSKVLANASFLDGCDKQVLPNSTTVEILCEGEAERGANGKWKVVSPLKVELR